MKELRELDIRILQALEPYPEGLTLDKVHEYSKSSLSIQNTHRVLNKLIKKELVIKHMHLYRLLNKGKELLTVSQPKHWVNPNNLKESSSSQPAQAQRMHAIQAHARLYPTSYSRVEATLTTLKIPFKKSGMHPAQYFIAWNDVELRISTKKLTIWGKEINAPININTSELEALALKNMLSQLELFIDKTGFKVQRSLQGNAIIRLRYWEVAFTNNEVARKATEKGDFIRLAFDRKTGLCTIWADRSDTSELETNKAADHKELRLWAQAVDDGIIHPYQDSLDTKRQLSELVEIERNNTKQIAEYARQIELHLKIMKKIDQKLSQKKLFE